MESDGDRGRDLEGPVAADERDCASDGRGRGRELQSHPALPGAGGPPGGATEVVSRRSGICDRRPNGDAPSAGMEDGLRRHSERQEDPGLLAAAPGNALSWARHPVWFGELLVADDQPRSDLPQSISLFCLRPGQGAPRRTAPGLGPGVQLPGTARKPGRRKGEFRHPPQREGHSLRQRRQTGDLEPRQRRKTYPQQGLLHGQGLCQCDRAVGQRLFRSLVGDDELERRKRLGDLSPKDEDRTEFPGSQKPAQCSETHEQAPHPDGEDDRHGLDRLCDRSDPR